MARKIQALTPNYDAAVTGYPEGSFRDNPGDLTGSGVVSAWGNDLHYGLAAVIYKYLGDKNGNAETTTASDFLNAFEAAMGMYSSSVSNWSAATDYSAAGNVSVMRYGMQFTSILASGNTNKDPMTNPTFWMPCPSANELFALHQEGRMVSGGSLSVHDNTNANYKQYFSLGTHKLGGYNGYAFTAYGVHLDGSSVGAGDLSTIIETWALKNSFAPGSTGSRTLQDARGRVMRFIDAAAGRADLIGEVLADQMQGHKHENAVNVDTNNFGTGVATYLISQAGSPSTQVSDLTNVPYTDGTNGTPRTGTVTADKSITVGVPYMVICVPA